MTRKTDQKARVALFSDFANHLVVVERVSADEIRISKARVVPKRKYTLNELLDRLTSSPAHGHPAVDWGPAVGDEAL